MSDAPLKKTNLYEWHVAAGARMTGFSGWDMPVQYPTGPREEHLRVRSAAGIFDIDHMGRLRVSGPEALAFLQSVQTWNLRRLSPGRAHYSLLCLESGGIIDDIFIYRLEDGAEWLVVVNAGNRGKDFAWMSARASGFDVEIRDVSDDTCMSALQGPEAHPILQALTKTGIQGLGFHRVTRCVVAGAPCTLCTTGYTGEPGFEIMAPAERSLEVWEAILEAGAPMGLVPCGLASRDTLRAEVCFPLYGHDIGEDTDPFGAGLSKAAVDLEGHEFIGRRALLELSQRAPARKLAGFRMSEPAVPRQGYPIAAAGRAIGAVTTGLFSPSTGGYLGMGYIEPDFARPGQKIEVVIRGASKAALIVERPFYRSPHWARS